MYKTMRLLRILLLVPIMLTAMLFPVAVHATPQSDLAATCAKAAQAGGEVPTYCTTSAAAASNDPLTGPGGILAKVTNLIAFFSGVIAVIMIIYSGFRLILSHGDTAKIVTARQTILYALVGLVVIIFARQIVIFILSKF